VSDIIDRIKKLLALSRSTNIHEAASAAEKAHRLMLEHKVSITDVSDVLPADVIEDSIIDARFMSTWRFGLLTACARNYYCSVVRVEDEIAVFGQRSGVRVTAIIMGRKDDVAAVRCLYEHFEAEIDRLFEEKFQAARVPGTPVTLLDIEKEEAWKKGAVVAIQERLQSQRVTFEREEPKAMTIGDKAREAVAYYQEKKFPDTYKPRVVVDTDERTSGSGYKAGLGVIVPREDVPRIEKPAGDA
jgi:hypothetical protein